MIIWLCEERLARFVCEWITSHELWTDITKEEELNEINENLRVSKWKFTVRKVDPQ